MTPIEQTFALFDIISTEDLEKLACCPLGSYIETEVTLMKEYGIVEES